MHRLVETTLSRRLTSLILLPVLFVVLLHGSVIPFQPGPVVAQALSNSAAATAVGGIIGACGLLVGIGVGLVGAALMGTTFGFGTALAISAGIHISAVACAI